MNLPLRNRWLERLDAAQTNSSWGARIETRVLRFLLARYAGSSQEAPLSDFPLYEGEQAPGRARALLSERESKKHLIRIEQNNLEREEIFEPIGKESVDWIVWTDLRNRRRREAFQHFGQTPPPPRWLLYGPAWLRFDVGQFLARISPRWSVNLAVRLALGLKLLGQILSSRR